MRDPVVSAAFEYVERAEDVALDVGVGLFQRVAHPRLSAQMHDAFEFFGGEQARHRIPIGQIRADEPERAVRREPGEARLLERDIVVIVQIVEPDHLVAAIEQALGGGSSNKSGGARNEKFHRSASILQHPL